MVRIGVPLLPGANEVDVLRAVRLAGAEAVPLWHMGTDLAGVDAVVVPGGATYGNYLRPGALAARAPILGAVTAAAAGGMAVLGVGTGFAVLCELGMLPGALVANAQLTFAGRDLTFTIESESRWTPPAGTPVELPLRTGWGQYCAAPAVLDDLEARGQVVLRFAGADPTGSARGIAGVANEAGNVVGVVAAPENAVEAGFGHSTDGLAFFAAAGATITAPEAGQ